MESAVSAARDVGALMRRELRSAKKIDSQEQFDIKLELDSRSQRRIEGALARAFPDIPLLGEEGDENADADADGTDYRWVVDPIDGTVNFAYGIPHACVSIALQSRVDPGTNAGGRGSSGSGSRAFQSLIGVVYDPFADELWTATRGQAARMNGRVIRVSRRRRLAEAIVSIGFAKSNASIRENLPIFIRLVSRVRKVRMMGAAALALTYVASGRFDGYIEGGIRIWDIAAGGLIVECAGGEFRHEALPGRHTYRMIASNGPMHRSLSRLRSEALSPRA